MVRLLMRIAHPLPDIAWDHAFFEQRPGPIPFRRCSVQFRLIGPLKGLAGLQGGALVFDASIYLSRPHVLFGADTLQFRTQPLNVRLGLGAQQLGPPVVD